MVLKEVSSAEDENVTVSVPDEEASEDSIHHENVIFILSRRVLLKDFRQLLMNIEGVGGQSKESNQ